MYLSNESHDSMYMFMSWPIQFSSFRQFAIWPYTRPDRIYFLAFGSSDNSWMKVNKKRNWSKSVYRIYFVELFLLFGLRYLMLRHRNNMFLHALPHVIMFWYDHLINKSLPFVTMIWLVFFKLRLLLNKTFACCQNEFKYFVSFI